MIFEIDDVLAYDIPAPACALDLCSERKNYAPPQRGERLIFRGFPNALREVAYDDCKLRFRAANIEARYLGLSVSSHCAEIEIVDLLGLIDLNGFSGSPLFSTTDPPRLRGIMVRATASSRRGHFIDAAVLHNVVKRLPPNVGRPTRP